MRVIGQCDHSADRGRCGHCRATEAAQKLAARDTARHALRSLTELLEHVLSPE
jgi:hypothetical protein